MDLFRIQHFYFTVIINVLCYNKVWLREAIISNIASINWIPTSPGCHLKEKLQVDCLGSGPRQLSWDTGRGSQGRCGEAMAIVSLGSTAMGLWAWGKACRLRLHHQAPARAMTTAVSWSCHSLAVAPDPGADHTWGPTRMSTGIMWSRQNKKQTLIRLQEN